jgi:3-mercaptopyruvate sulfurtransferase SseA
MIKSLARLSLAALLASCLSVVRAQENDLTAAPRITISDLQQLIKAGGVVIVDVRGGDSYRAGHIPGAISLPLEAIPDRWKELPQDRPIITYCS